MVRPSSGNAPQAAPAGVTNVSPAAAAPGTPAPQTEAQRLQTVIAKTRAERRRRELERALEGHLASCRAELDRLRGMKAYASNNLAGAQWETSISQEMSAAVSGCSAETQMLTSELDAVRRECVALGCALQ
jgi:hypothetical protein